ncbi:alpha/beta hydrolase [Endozoicomonas sp. SESOKO1]|uniref:alpha/beta hydrolase n=1 Tax=Endozoicomonas sp. SESOKO1 TaxID=2828742 RepID=UPI0021485016|nr:alpha/beta hydrolase [Endozoicomonas sp. SESOKO1]
MDKLKLISDMRPLSYDLMTPTPHEQAYFEYYNIDLENSIAGIQHYLGYINSTDYRIACHLYTRAGAKGSLFLLHGYYDHVGLFGHIIRFFLQEGYNVLAYDLPGHGLSSGQPATIKDFEHYRLVLEDVMHHSQSILPRPWLAYGQSTGCAIITELLNHSTRQGMPMPFEQVIFSAPLVRPRLWQLSRLQLYLVRPFIHQIPRKFKDNCRDKNFLNKAHNDPLAPTVLPTQWVSALDRWIRKIESSTEQIPLSPLILQGTNDTTVDGPYNIQVLGQLYRAPRILWLEGARHHLPNELTETRVHYMQWLSREMNDRIEPTGSPNQ